MGDGWTARQPSGHSWAILDFVDGLFFRRKESWRLHWGHFDVSWGILGYILGHLVRELSRQLGFRAPAWSVLLCLNDLALIVSENCVKFDEDYETAQLAGHGVAFRGEPLRWSDVVRFRELVNASGRFREQCGGKIKKPESCHLACEARQFYRNADRAPHGEFSTEGTEKRDLCQTLAKWCLSLR